MKYTLYLRYLVYFISVIFLVFWYRVYNSTDWISEDIKSFERLQESLFAASISFGPLLVMTPISFPLSILGIRTNSYPDGI